MGAEVATDEPNRRKRASERTHLYLAAILRWHGQEGVVRIRNLSSDGAMIEGGALPPVGSPVLLTRGRLQSAGHIAWQNVQRCGIHITQPLDVCEWMAPPANRAQSHIDNLVLALRNGQAPSYSQPSAAMLPPTPPARLVRTLVSRVVDQLSANPVIIAGYARQLQQLELSLELLEAMDASLDDGARLARLRTAAEAALDHPLDT